MIYFLFMDIKYTSFYFLSRVFFKKIFILKVIAKFLRVRVWNFDKIYLTVDLFCFCVYCSNMEQKGIWQL